MKNIAIVMAAGKGKRMKSIVPKQFLILGNEPMWMKSLRVFDKNDIIDEIVLVTSKDHIDECRKIIKKSDIRKVKKIVEGGKERYASVYEGLKVCSNCRYVFIHDSARPYVTNDIVRRAYDAVKKNPAVVVGMPAKDTIKIVDENGYVTETPVRTNVWTIQTPQVFRYEIIKEAYDRLIEKDDLEGITDDAMVIERTGLAQVQLVEGSYDNIKITTPDDLHGEELSDKKKKKDKDKEKSKDKDKDKSKDKDKKKDKK